jgi:hypothetical protein
MKRGRLALLACMFIAGCGGGQHATSATTMSLNAPNPTAQLERAVRTALDQNAKVSDYVLWHNAIPSWASQSTAGPALAGMRGSAAQRNAGGVRVRVLTGRVKIRSVALNPSYLGATASVVEESRVRIYKKGHPGRRTITLTEPAQVDLQRVGDTTRFVVWKLALAR